MNSSNTSDSSNINITIPINNDIINDTQVLSETNSSLFKNKEESECYNKLNFIISLFNPIEQDLFTQSYNDTNDNLNNPCFNSTIYKNGLKPVLENLSVEYNEYSKSKLSIFKVNIMCLIMIPKKLETNIKPFKNILNTILYHHSQYNQCKLNFIEKINEIIYERRRFLFSTMLNLKLYGISSSQNNQIIDFPWEYTEIESIVKIFKEYALCSHRFNYLLYSKIIDAYRETAKIQSSTNLKYSCNNGTAFFNNFRLDNNVQECSKIILKEKDADFHLNIKRRCIGNINTECNRVLHFQCGRTWLFDYLKKNPLTSNVFPNECNSNIVSVKADKDKVKECFNWFLKNFIVGSMSFNKYNEIDSLSLKIEESINNYNKSEFSEFEHNFSFYELDKHIANSLNIAKYVNFTEIYKSNETFTEDEIFNQIETEAVTRLNSVSLKSNSNSIKVNMIFLIALLTFFILVI